MTTATPTQTSTAGPTTVPTGSPPPTTIAYPLTIVLRSGRREVVASLHGCRVLAGETADDDRFALLATAVDGRTIAVEQRHIEAAVDRRGSTVEIRSSCFKGHPDYPGPSQDREDRSLGATARELADGFRRLGLKEEVITLNYGVGSNGAVV